MSRTITITPSGERRIVTTRTFDAPKQQVFDAFTRPKMLKCWMFGPDGWSLPHCEVDLKPGGRWRYLWRHDDGREMAASGEYLEISPPDKLVHTERFDEDWTGGETIVTTRFTEKSGRTTVTLSIEYAAGETRDRVLKSPMAAGMEAGYARLDRILLQQHEA
ncbi:SRPBCC family protein [Hyphococcus sp.]|uniref:SRPBCC family protein n=1 Tax=Hyphococcus sp. TaxID=2038636 RepID=UPI0020801251|nr:MAG: ATPase [Marinicaulis sp.]